MGGVWHGTGARESLRVSADQMHGETPLLSGRPANCPSGGRWAVGAASPSWQGRVRNQ